MRGTARGDQIFTLPLLGDKFEMKRMLYNDARFEFSSVGGILKTHYFRANDVYDPDATGAGHQPIGFDQAMLFWEQFAVFGSKITVTFFSNSAQAVRVGIFLNPDQTDPATFNSLMENGLVKTTVVQGDPAQSSGSMQCKSVSMNFSSIKYYQYKNKETYFANINFIGTVASSPTELAYFGVFAYDFTGANNFDVFYDVTLSYDVRFQEPRKITSSLLVPVMQRLHDEKTKELSETGLLLVRNEGKF